MSNTIITSWLSDFVDSGGFEFPWKTGELKYSRVEFEKIAPFVSDDKKRSRHLRDNAQHRNSQSEIYLERLRAMTDANLFWVLTALADGQIRPVEIAKTLGKRRYEVTREVRRVYLKIRGALLG